VAHLSYLSHLQPGVDHALAHGDIPIVLKVTVSIAAGKGTEKWKHFESNPIKGPTSFFHQLSVLVKANVFLYCGFFTLAFDFDKKNTKKLKLRELFQKII